MTFFHLPLRAELLIAKHRPITELREYLGQRITVLHQALGLDPRFVAQIAISAVRHPLVGHGAAGSIVPKAQDLSACTQLSVHRIVEDIALEGALGYQSESKRIGC